ncbi:hypothetical protein INT43_002608 [Umbelopsis isabellina]|uniref:SAP domain-containing protein n=1 Tax=Mortierella isabellina TaxID=91625 RepID=A0A8H7UK67_MORIS|nr:hypothetical protein INT43_002608 [Umbelopsis isabellina]
MSYRLIAPALTRSGSIARYRHVLYHEMQLPLMARSGFTATACTFDRWTRNSLRKLKKANLETLAQERKLNKKGTKDEIVARLIAWQENERRSTQTKTLTNSSDNKSRASAEAASPPKDTSFQNTVIKSTKDEIVQTKSSNTDKEQTTREQLSSPTIAVSEVFEVKQCRDNERVRDSENIGDHSQKADVVKRMSEYLEETLPEHDNSVVDINYENQTDETILPENWIKAFEMKVTNRSNRVGSKKATMTFKTREPRSLSPRRLDNIITQESVADPTTPVPEFEGEFDQQWVDAFDRKVAQRGSRRLLELASQDYDSKITSRSTEDDFAADITRLTIALNDNMTMTEAKYTPQATTQICARDFLQNLTSTPLTELSIEKLLATPQHEKRESNHERQSQHDKNDEQSNRPDGNHFATAALSATVLIWLIYGQDGVHKAVSSAKKLRRSKSSEA